MVADLRRDGCEVHAAQSSRRRALVLPLAAGAFCTQPADKYSVLARRVATAASNEAEVQCIILDAMVPKQRFEFLFPPPIGGMLRRLRQEQATLCVLGMTHTVDRSGQPKLGKLLNRGVEARIESLLSVPLGNTEGFFSRRTPRRSDGPKERAYLAAARWCNVRTMRRS